MTTLRLLLIFLFNLWYGYIHPYLCYLSEIKKNSNQFTLAHPFLVYLEYNLNRSQYNSFNFHERLFFISDTTQEQHLLF